MDSALRFADEGVIIDCLYELQAKFTPDEQLVRLRELKVAKLKKDMGDKYLLAKPIIKGEYHE